MNYGDKRDYSKIDIFLHGVYVCSTTWAKSCREAEERYREEAEKHHGYFVYSSEVKAYRAQ